MLVRHLIRQRLNEYYNQPVDKVVGSVLSSTSNSNNRSSLSSSFLSKQQQQVQVQQQQQQQQQQYDNVPYKLSNLGGEFHWKYLYRKLYNEQSGQWLTPVELFQPYYSNCIANYIVQQYHTSCPSRNNNDNNNNNNNNNNTSTNQQLTTLLHPVIEIIELGGGRGTNAYYILQHMAQNHPLIYNQIQSYTIYDSSIPLHTYQQQRLVLLDPKNTITTTTTNNIPSSKYNFQLIDIVDIAENKIPFFVQKETKQQEQHQHPQQHTTTNTTTTNNNNNVLTFIIGCEVLDNLPHDKIRIIGNDSTTIEQAELVVHNNSNHSTIHHQQHQEQDENNNHHHRIDYKEIYHPLSDPLLQQILEVCPSYYRTVRPSTKSTAVREIWIPTIACHILRQIYQERPYNTHLLFADFDWLPQPDNPYRYDPITQTYNHPSSNTTTNNNYDYYHRPINEPLITDMNDQDYDNYINAPKYCDILYPTNFYNLANYVQQVYQQQQQQESLLQVTVQKQYEFLQRYGPDEIKKTQSWLTGYTPLLADFMNCSILTASSSSSSGTTGS